METQNYYFRVGIFFLIVTVTAVLFLSRFIFEEPETRFERYVIYFEGAVSGLNQGARVAFKGIEVGRVRNIGFHSYQDDMIEVIVDIQETAPIREDTVASVRYQGITGASYIYLDNEHPDQPPVYLQRQPGQRYPIIRSDQSDLYAALSNAPEVLAKISGAGAQVQSLLSDENIEIFASIMHNIDALIGEDNRDSFAKLLENLGQFFDEQNTESVNSMIRNLDAALIEAKITLREYRLLAKTLREDPSRIVRSSTYRGYELRE